MKPGSKDQQAIIDKLLQELRLPSIARDFREVNEEMTQQNASFLDFIEVLLQREAESRWDKRIARYLKDSQLPSTKTFANLQWDRFSTRVRRQIANLRRGEFLAKAENILAFGLPGRGKTHLLCALCHELTSRGRRVKYVTAVNLVQDLLRAKSELTLQRLFKRMDRLEALFIDDFGYVQYSREEMDVLFALLAHRYERRSVLLTSNLAFKEWGSIFKDELTAMASIDRLVHHSEVLHLRGQSYRNQKKKAKASSK